MTVPFLKRFKIQEGRLRELYTGSGAWGVARGCGRYLLKALWSYEKHFVFLGECATESGCIAALEPSVSLGTKVDITDMFATGLIRDEEKERFIRKLDEGLMLVLCRNGRALQGYAFVDLEHLTVMGVRIRLNHDEAYNDTNYVFPKYRGQGVQAILLQNIKRLVSGRGRRWCYSLALAHNRPSIKGHIRGGFSPIGTIRALKLRGTPRIHLSRDLRLRWLNRLPAV